MFGVVDRSFEKRFDVTFDRGERGLEFMRDVGHKFPPHVLELAQLRDIVQCGEYAGLASAEVDGQRAHGVPGRLAQALGIPGALLVLLAYGRFIDRG